MQLVPITAAIYVFIGFFVDFESNFKHKLLVSMLPHHNTQYPMCAPRSLRGDGITLFHFVLNSCAYVLFINFIH